MTGKMGSKKGYLGKKSLFGFLAAKVLRSLTNKSLVENMHLQLVSLNATTTMSLLNFMSTEQAFYTENHNIISNSKHSLEAADH